MRPTRYHRYTKQDLAYISEHRYDKIQDVADHIGAPRNTVAIYMQKFRNGERLKHDFPLRRYYALYRRGTDELVCSGTAKECAEALGILRTSFDSLVSKVKSGKNKKWEVYVDDMDDDYNEEEI